MYRLILGAFIFAVALALAVLVADTPASGFQWWAGFIGGAVLMLFGGWEIWNRRRGR